MTEQQMVKIFQIGRSIDYYSLKLNKVLQARIVGSWWDMREGLASYGANVCITFEHDRLRYTQWVNEKFFKTDFPNTEIPNEVV